MKILCFEIKVSLPDLFGINALDSSMDKFRELRDGYREANREYFGEYLFAILDEK